MKRSLVLLTSILGSGAALADNTLTSGTSVLFRGSTNLGTFATHAACKESAASRVITTQTTYQCRENLTAVPVAAPPPPPPPPPPPGGAAAYSTNFDGTEYPLSEGGAWFKAANPWTYVRMEGGQAYGTNGITNSYDDSVAFLTHPFGPDQTVEAVVQVNSGAVGSTHEVELWLRGGSNSNNLWGYELCFWRTGQVQIGVWHGPFGQVDTVDSNLPVPWTPAQPLKTGDVIKAEIKGNVIKAYINGVLKTHASHSKFTSGQPGIGFFIRPGGSNKLVTLTKVSASSN